MLIIKYLLFICLIVRVRAYYECKPNENPGLNGTVVSQNQLMQCSIRASKDTQPFDKITRLLGNLHEEHPPLRNAEDKKISLPQNEDPIKVFEKAVHQFVFGPKVDNFQDQPQNIKDKLSQKGKGMVPEDMCAQFPSGTINRAELFNKRTSVHFPPLELLHKGHCYLEITNDTMQTAIDAFAIFVAGNLDDINRLPPRYVLKSARAISMIKANREKLSATWGVVKRGRKTITIPYQTLELYRPLFKYINGREIARLNLRDDRILTFIGTHPDLNRHQVGVVASRYMQINSNWSQVRYLNMMNNLLCGVPMSFMRKIESNVYLQLTHQVFYHIRACDPMQRRFYLAMMTRTEALGKSYSWNARDVSRLGLLLAEVSGPDLAAINPEAMSGITAQVMLKMPAQSLQYITEMQLRYLELKPLNILARSLKEYQDKLKELSNSQRSVPCLSTLSLVSYALFIMIK